MKNRDGGACVGKESVYMDFRWVVGREESFGGDLVRDTQPSMERLVV